MSILSCWIDRKKSRSALTSYRVVASVLSDVGCERATNEDFAHYVLPASTDRSARKGMLALIADGMGGHSAGEVASKMAADVVSRVYYQSRKNPVGSLVKGFKEANRAIYTKGLSEPGLRGMGTTCTALVLKDGFAHCAHVGDTRLYLLRAGALYLLTQDHSLVMEMVRQRLLSREEARSHVDRNVLLRAMGTRPRLEVSTWSKPMSITVGDQFVLCTDGLYDLVMEDEIKDVLTRQDPQVACKTLVEMARRRGGYDNITVGIFALVSPQTPPAGSVRETRNAQCHVQEPLTKAP